MDLCLHVTHVLFVENEGQIKAKGKVAPAHHAMKTYWGSGGIAPRIFDLGTRLR
jgi:hypothetical protein